MKSSRLLKRVLTVALMLAMVLPTYAKEVSEPQQEKVDYKAAIANAYKAYSLETFKTAKEKTVKCAEVLYKQELAKGKTDKEFKGFTVVNYCFEVFDKSEYENEITQADKLALLLPFILAALIIVALVLSIRLGLGSMRRLTFNNSATVFNNK